MKERLPLWAQNVVRLLYFWKDECVIRRQLVKLKKYGRSKILQSEGFELEPEIDRRRCTHSGVEHRFAVFSKPNSSYLRLECLDCAGSQAGTRTQGMEVTTAMIIPFRKKA